MDCIFPIFWRMLCIFSFLKPIIFKKWFFKNVSSNLRKKYFPTSKEKSINTNKCSQQLFSKSTCTNVPWKRLIQSHAHNKVAWRYHHMVLLKCCNDILLLRVVSTDRSSRLEVFCKKVFIEISQNLQKNTCGRVSFLMELQAWCLQLY